jgi:hypothetical protein
MGRRKKVQEVQERKDYHHLGSPDVNDVFYHKDNMEMTIIFRANGSNTTFLNDMDKVEYGDELYLGLSDEDAEQLCEQLITALGERFKMKLDRYNQYKKTYWVNELDGKEEEWNDSNWNLFKQEEE